MITDNQVRRLKLTMQREKSITRAADKVGIDEKTARKYIRLNRLPSEVRSKYTWRKREDPFKDVWDELLSMSRVCCIF